MVVGVPTLASANPVNDLLNNLGLGGVSGGSAGSSGGSSSAPTTDTRAGAPPTYTPPLHGTNPHGQGTAATVDLTPSDTNPYPASPSSSEEQVILGDSRGEQNPDGTYHGSTALAYLLGSAILPVETNPGESKDGPLQPLQDVLDQVCDGSSNQVCVSALEQHSSTSSNSSTNSFQALGANIGGIVNASVASSHGNISDDGTCQTSHGDSQVADAQVGNSQAGIGADLIEGSSDSTACNSGSQSVSQSSHVLGFGGALAGLDIPVTSQACENGTPNSTPSVLGLEQVIETLGVAALVCNADDTNAGQTSSPYGVREGLAVGLLDAVRIATAGPESHAAAPAAPTTPTTPTNPGGGGTKGAGGKGGNAGGNGNGSGAGNGPAAATATAGNGQLAFTGADLLVLGLVGGGLILGGLALTTTAGRRHRQTI